MEFGLWSIIPAIVAVGLAFWLKEVISALFFALLAGEMILHQGDIFDATSSLVERLLSQFNEGWIVKTLLFALLVGSIVKLIVKSGGVDSFVYYLSHKKQLVQSKRGSLLLAYIIGFVIFIESSITSLVAGTVARPLSDKYGASREKLAYVCDSTAAPVSSLVIFNAWGALLLGLITVQINNGMLEGNALSVLAQSVMFNIYSIISLIMVLYIILSERDFGPMRFTEEKQQLIDNRVDQFKTPQGTIWNMMLPMIILIGVVPIALYISGDGDMLQGSGSTAVFWAVISTIVISGIWYILTRTMQLRDFMQHVTSGAGEMVGIVAILLFAFTLGDMMKSLETAQFIASAVQNTISPQLLALIIFVVAALIAFSTGTSWGTFAIMIPIAVALSDVTGAYAPLVIGAVISGGVFGDHTSVISDTTIISSMAAQCDVVDHVKTQLPYAIVSALISMIFFIGLGYVL
jgi:Na+/H+ antiporter NhaC